MKIILVVAALFAALNPFGFLFANAIEWNFNNKATALGSGCNMDDTFFISAGNEVSILFSSLGVELDGHQEGKLKRRKSCRIKVPALIKRGFYISNLSSSLLYGLVRSEGTEAHVNLQYRFIGMKYSRNKDHGKNPRESRNIPLAELRDVTRVRNPKRCNGRDFRSVLFARASVAASRKTLTEGIVIHLDGLSLRLDASARVDPC
ncbi:MAG: hypothetical protein AB8G05_06415 [Oligoflexales bacterium]